MARPTNFTPKTADKICERIADGESLRKISEDADMPHASTVHRWLADEAQGAFREQYARAREDQADFYADQIIEIADEGAGGEGGAGDDNTAVQRARLRVDARKWKASKLAPKKYGDKVQFGGDPDNPVVTEIRQIIVDH